MSNNHAFDLLLSVWTFCEVEDREAFVAYLRVSGAINQPTEADETRGGLPVAAASGTAEETGRTPAYAIRGRDGTPHRSGVTGGESATTNFPSDGVAIAAVKGKARLANATGVEPPPSDIDPQPTSSQAADPAGDAVPPASSADKPGCLKLKDGHCHLSFATEALCWRCNGARTARAAA